MSWFVKEEPCLAIVSPCVPMSDLCCVQQGHSVTGPSIELGATNAQNI